MAEFSTIVVITALDFIDYSLFATGVLIAYYIFRFASFEEEGRRAAREAEIGERQKRIWDFGKKKYDELKESGKREKRKHLLEGTLSFIIQAEQNTEKALSELRLNTPKALGEVRDLAGRISNNLRSAKRTIRSTRLQAQGNNDLREYLTKMAAEVEAMEQELKRKVRETLPDDAEERGYANKITAAETSLKLIRDYCGMIIKSIYDFEKKEDMTHISNFRPK
jgi:phage host-nuclease inhibitor protein Gam